MEWFLNNVARNSLAIISNIEMESLELQRLWAMSKIDRVKLRATFGWVPQERGSVQTTRPGMRHCRAHDAHASSARQIPAVVVPWFLNNVARNSLAIISNIEIGSLELQRLWAMSKNDRVKLRATFGWVPQERERVQTTRPGARRGRADNAGVHTTLPGRAQTTRPGCMQPGRVGRIRSPSPRPRCPRPRPSRRTSRNPRRSRGSRPRWGSGPPGSRGSRRSRRAGTGPRTPGS